jgi:hypothetical protein
MKTNTFTDTINFMEITWNFFKNNYNSNDPKITTQCNLILNSCERIEKILNIN